MHKMSSLIDFVIFFAILLGTGTSERCLSVGYERPTGSVFVTETSKEILNPVSWAHFENDINKTGWAYLEVYTNESFSDELQAYSAGLIEGYITQDLIKMHVYNTLGEYCPQPYSQYCRRLLGYLEQNLRFMERMISERPDDSYWHQVSMVLHQLAGLSDGYHGNNSSAPRLLTTDDLDIIFLHISGDLMDLEVVFDRPDRDRTVGSGSCSALIKLLPGFIDLYVAQDTWSEFSSMLRILKLYDLPLHTTDKGEVVPGHRMTFSSYPGVIYSGDDFSIMGSGLVSQETTIGNNNATRWKYVEAEWSVLEGTRCTVANRLASSSGEWTDIFAGYNSGTYNNQWMVVDYKKFTAGQKPTHDLLFVIEQIPGMTVAKDMTEILTGQGYWPSYNIPYFPEVFNASGGPDSVKKYGDWFTYDKSPRAQIFRRDHGKVKDLDTMTKLMRYNDYTHDPLSACQCSPPYSAENAISARSDLNPANGSYPFSALGHRAHGGTDMKLTSTSLAAGLQFIAVSSPTYDDVPPFSWSTSDFHSTARHMGHPDTWKFTPVTHKWSEDKVTKCSMT